MKEAEEQIRAFMLKADQVCPGAPCIPNKDVRLLRARLIMEEVLELIAGLGVAVIFDKQNWHPLKYELIDFQISATQLPNLEQIADGCADAKVVVIGTEVACGIPSDLIWEEVIRSNDSKFIDGYKDEFGKWIKGPGYSPANLKPLLGLPDGSIP